MEKPHVDIVFIGHVDHGKSTLVGRLLFDSGQVDPHIMDEFKEEAARMGKTTFEFAWVMDDTKEERERGVTIRSQIREFQTEKYYFTIVDAPGHPDFLRNMIKGTRQADHAILVVAAKEGVQAQTKEHVYLSRTFGIDQVVVAINKMDSTFPPFDQTRYDEIKSEVGNLLKLAGYKEGDYFFVPVAAYQGDNVVKPSDRMPWYKGPSLYQMLDKLRLPKRASEKPFRLPVQHIFNVHGVGYIPVGKVETGTLRPGDVILFMPINKRAEVRTIEMHGKPLEVANPGDSIGVDLRTIGGWGVKNEIRVGVVAGSEKSPPSVAEEFEAQIAILEHSTGIRPGYRPIIHCHTEQVACELMSIESKIDPATGGALQEKPESLRSGDAAVVKFRPLRPIVIEKASEFSRLGRFAIRDSDVTVGVGVVLDVTKKAFA